MSREELLETNERLRAVRIRLEESYDTAKKALVTLMNKYGDSKSQRNVFNRYPMLKLMIKDVIRLETQYWTLVEIPKQEKLETVPAFVLRACSIMEKSQKSGEGVKTSAKLAEEAAEKRERMERLEMMTTAQIEQENTQMINDLYRLLKKYTGLRNLIRELKAEYGNSKIYPIFPRYTMLKDMIKDIMHDPDYMEVCHERVVTPKYVARSTKPSHSRGTAALPVQDYELEAITNLTLSNALRQLASLVLISNQIFTELNKELASVSERSLGIKQRIDNLSKRVEEFDPKQVAVLGSFFFHFVHLFSVGMKLWSSDVARIDETTEALVY
ncbi:hypothetical protein RP20_CCG015003 [Aedes albopictus]|nr:hypothetical protein RP20_CCG015003 [Aedes albopictus]